MNQIELQKAAIGLENLLEKYCSQVAEARLCLAELRPIIKKAQRNEIIEPMKHVPCGYYFHEGALRQFREIEEAYSTFAVLLRGKDPQEIAELLRQL